MTDRRSLLRFALRTLAALAAVVMLALLAATLALPGWITGRGAALATEKPLLPAQALVAHSAAARAARRKRGIRLS